MSKKSLKHFSVRTWTERCAAFLNSAEIDIYLLTCWWCHLLRSTHLNFKWPLQLRFHSWANEKQQHTRVQKKTRDSRMYISLIDQSKKIFWHICIFFFLFFCMLSDRLLFNIYMSISRWQIKRWKSVCVCVYRVISFKYINNIITFSHGFTFFHHL